MLTNNDQMLDASSLLDSVHGQSPSRRTLLKTTALGVGYAASAGTAVAQTAIKTSSEGLTVGEVMVDVTGFKVPAYVARPAGKTNLPVVLVIQEVFGVHEYIADTARRFAKAGYMAIAPELFARQGDPTKYNVIADLVREVVSKVPDGQVMTDLDAMVAWARANGGDTNKVAVTGFCWGGRITWLYAAHSRNVKAGVAWYGRLVGQASELTPKHPVDVVSAIHGPVLGLYGSADTGIPMDTVERMKVALKTGSAAAQKSEFVVYDGAPHAFHADYRPSYRAEPAADGFKRCVEWFKTHGVA
ncbi:dienelactone hydrolase family protein [Variovorax sp. PCZ-1]|uniref:dienelactone hydrolase family protein n=1 Tax=Variovorax sp. PCZ-1 TaxID=2835533 RepID=UPI001BCC29A6|nr:dienelactone hydrolase family protein [Variovorax sp. PCZ-1]MBS7808470.1 dienelactone hydrolase family protein [Variovorax sp. PCZ-1]